MTVEVEALNLRMSRIEVRLEELNLREEKIAVQPRKRTLFVPPDDIDKELYKKMVELRKKLVSENHNAGLNLIFNGCRLCSIIQSNCRTLDDLRKLKGFGEKNIAEFGNQFLEVLNSPETEIVIEEPEPTVVPPAPPAPPAPTVPTASTAQQKKASKIKRATQRCKELCP
jgi:hypothetical protein